MTCLPKGGHPRKELTTPIPDDLAIIQAAARLTEPKRLVKRHSPEYEVLWRHSPFGRIVIDSRPAGECWSLLTEYTFPTPIDTAWIDALSDDPVPDFEAIGEVHRDEWAVRARAIKKARADWRAAELTRAQVVRDLARTKYRGIIFDEDLLAVSLQRHLAYLQSLASGPFDRVPVVPVSAIVQPSRNRFRRPSWRTRAA